MSGGNACPPLNQSCSDVLGTDPPSCSDVKKNKTSFIEAMQLPPPFGAGCSKSVAEKLQNELENCACGLSTGAIVGIVVGSLAFIAIIVFIVLRMRRKK